MKPYFSLRFVALIGVMLCAAIAVRVFAANNQKTSAQFKVTIMPRAQTIFDDPDKFYSSLQKTNSLVESSVCLHWYGQQRKDWCPKHKTEREKSPPVQTMSPPPHIQQTVEFTNPAGLKALADALTNSPRPAENVVSPGTSPPPPPPHIQQTAGLDSTPRDKAIADALQH
jgi:hypothetical protein